MQMLMNLKTTLRQKVDGLDAKRKEMQTMFNTAQSIPDDRNF